MTKCATCVFHEKDKRMENEWFLPNYIEVKTMRFPCGYPNAWKTHVAHFAMHYYHYHYSYSLPSFVAHTPVLGISTIRLPYFDHSGKCFGAWFSPWY